MTVFDVAEYILQRCGDMTAMKLQKLCYYAQAWSLVWDDRPMFEAKMEAWANGPVSPLLYSRHRGKFSVSSGDFNGDPSTLDHDALETVEAILAEYGEKSAHWLSDLTHSEPPWSDAREGLKAGERGNREITLAAMVEYYSSL